MEPPLPPKCLGNFAYGATVHCEAAAKDDTVVTAVQLVEKIRDSLRAVNDGAARKMYGEGGLLRNGAQQRFFNDNVVHKQSV